MEIRKDNTFVAFKNDRKEKDGQPDLKGYAKIGGQQMEVAIWIRESKKGEEYWSGKVTPKREPEPQPAATGTEKPF